MRYSHPSATHLNANCQKQRSRAAGYVGIALCWVRFNDALILPNSDLYFVVETEPLQVSLPCSFDLLGIDIARRSLS
ncbi:hypothetical protein MTYM_02094 [Methylococcales bacterium]|nr:hypothetical protein MTYM_02094 [Methylococcales bacterium]